MLVLEGEVKKPQVAKKINYMLLDMDDKNYISKEWDVREGFFDVVKD